MSRTNPVPPRSGSIALLLALAFGVLFAATSRGVFLYGDDVLMFQVTEAIVERGEVNVTSRAPGNDVTRSIRGTDGRRYAKYGLGQSLVAIPFFAAARPLFAGFELPESRDRFGNVRTGVDVFGTGLTNAALGGATVAVTFLLALEIGLPVAAALALPLLLAFGTLWSHYASTFLSEPLAGLCLVTAVWSLSRCEREARTREGRFPPGLWLAISGFACGLAVATKVVLVATVWPLGLWAAFAGWRAGASGRERRTAIDFVLHWGVAFLLWIAVVAIYNQSRFGDPFATGYGEEARQFTTPLLAGLAGLIASPSVGLLWFCPVLLLSIVGARSFFRRQRGLALAILGMSACHLLVVAKYYQWFGGDCLGPRFLVPLLPLWLLPAGEVLKALPAMRLASRALVTLAVLASLAATLGGLLVPWDSISDRATSSLVEMSRSAWDFERSTLFRQLERLPQAVELTLAKLFSSGGFRSSGKGLAEGGMPDFAFVRYGSHALLQWTRGGLALFAACLGGALWLARRSQKALLSRPPQ